MQGYKVDLLASKGERRSLWLRAWTQIWSPSELKQVLLAVVGRILRECCDSHPLGSTGLCNPLIIWGSINQKGDYPEWETSPADLEDSAILSSTAVGRWILPRMTCSWKRTPSLRSDPYPGRRLHCCLVRPWAADLVVLCLDSGPTKLWDNKCMLS